MKGRALVSGLVAILLVGLAAAPVWAPRLLPRVAWFDVERVEVTGTHLLAPHEVLAASGIRPGQSVWERPEAWEAALRSHPVIADARVSRRLPRTLRVRVEEELPVALLEAGALRPATAAGLLLPVDPARVALDLPLLRIRRAARADGADGADGGLAPPELRALLAETGRLTALDPGLLARVSELEGNGAGELQLRLAHPAAEVLLLTGASSRRLKQLRVALEALERNRGDEAGPLRIDARFADQIVVRN